jgi:hypothetical protein
MVRPLEPVVRFASLRRSRVTKVTGFAPGDQVSAAWDAEKREYKLVIQSANGLRIEHKRLTLPPSPA